MGLFVRSGISYESDLYQIEEVCTEVIDYVMDTDSNAAIESPRRFGFEEFGDSNVNFFPCPGQGRDFPYLPVHSLDASLARTVQGKGDRYQLSSARYQTELHRSYCLTR